MKDNELRIFVAVRRQNPGLNKIREDCVGPFWKFKSDWMWAAPGTMGYP